MKKYYLKEFSYHDGEGYITFTILDFNLDNKTITLASVKQGKISVITYDLKQDRNGVYFEYGSPYREVYLEDYAGVL